eukprot:16446572-Heterocapsa_arctica.AAC.1
MEKVHMGNIAEESDTQNRDSNNDFKQLVKHKKKRDEETCSCEQKEVGQAHNQEVQNYKKWKYKKKSEAHYGNQHVIGVQKHLY